MLYLTHMRNVHALRSLRMTHNSPFQMTPALFAAEYTRAPCCHLQPRAKVQPPFLAWCPTIRRFLTFSCPGNSLKGRNVLVSVFLLIAMKRLTLIRWTVPHVTCLAPTWAMDRNNLCAHFYGKENSLSCFCSVLTHIPGRQTFS